MAVATMQSLTRALTVMDGRLSMGATSRKAYPRLFRIIAINSRKFVMFASRGKHAKFTLVMF